MLFTLCLTSERQEIRNVDINNLAAIPINSEVAANYFIMLFKDVKIGYPIYFLDKEVARYYQGKAVSVAVPRYDNNQAKAFGAQPTGLVVDITIEADGATKT